MDKATERVDEELRGEHGTVVSEASPAFADRDLAGEYERREDPDATPSPQAREPEQLPPGKERERAEREQGE